MTNVGSIDMATQNWQLDPGTQLAQDFAQELAKQEAQEKSKQQSQQKVEGERKSASQDNEIPAHIEAQQVTSGSRAEPLLQTISTTEQATIAQEHALANVAVSPTDLTEAILGARVYGWHAQAQAYLSELMLAGERVDPQAAKNEAKPSPGASLFEVANEVSSSAAPAEVQMSASTQTTLASTSSRDETRVSSDDAAPARAKEISMSNASLAGYWAERSLRFTRQRDGSSVAWLRDFRISSSEIPHLVALALSDANAKGLKLSRIMLNGQQAWSSGGIQEDISDVS